MSRPESYDEKRSSEEKIPADAVQASLAHHVEFRVDQVDSGAQLVAGGVEVGPEEAARVLKKIDWHIMPLMCSKCSARRARVIIQSDDRAVLYWIQFMDKTTLGSAAILGIRFALLIPSHSACTHRQFREATHLTTNQCVFGSLLVLRSDLST